MQGNSEKWKLRESSPGKFLMNNLNTATDFSILKRNSGWLIAEGMIVCRVADNPKMIRGSVPISPVDFLYNLEIENWGMIGFWKSWLLKPLWCSWVGLTTNTLLAFLKRIISFCLSMKSFWKFSHLARCRLEFFHNPEMFSGMLTVIIFHPVIKTFWWYTHLEKVTSWTNNTDSEGIGSTLHRVFFLWISKQFNFVFVNILFSW